VPVRWLVTTGGATWSSCTAGLRYAGGDQGIWTRGHLKATRMPSLGSAAVTSSQGTAASCLQAPTCPSVSSKTWPSALACAASPNTGRLSSRELVAFVHVLTGSFCRSLRVQAAGACVVSWVLVHADLCWCRPVPLLCVGEWAQSIQGHKHQYKPAARSSTRRLRPACGS
jgi:hypothetical protein